MSRRNEKKYEYLFLPLLLLLQSGTENICISFFFCDGAERTEQQSVRSDIIIVIMCAKTRHLRERNRTYVKRGTYIRMEEEFYNFFLEMEHLNAPCHGKSTAG